LVHRLTGISQFVFHPDESEIRRIAMVSDFLPDDIHLSVENMDIEKRNFQSLAEVDRLLDSVPGVTLTFDMCHWLEMGFDLESPALRAFLVKHRDRFRILHCSAHKSDHDIYKDYGFIKHRMLLGSGVTLTPSFLELLPGDCTVTLEGYVPLGRSQEALTEIRTVRAMLAERPESEEGIDPVQLPPLAA
jgi:hypothetical protein